MQPYFFPYIGYFQLINWADKFVLYNDAQYIKGGWINRNNILVNGSKHQFCFSLEKQSAFSKITERIFDPKKKETEQKKFLKTIQLAYSKAPYFNLIYPLLESIQTTYTANLSKSIYNSLKVICNYIDIKTELLLSENIPYDRNADAQNKVIDICLKLNGNRYANSIGGLELYSKDIFKASGIELNFLKTNPIKYKQFNNEFIPGLSIIDVLMFNSKEEIKKILEEYELS